MTLRVLSNALLITVPANEPKPFHGGWLFVMHGLSSSVSVLSSVRSISVATFTASRSWKSVAASIASSANKADPKAGRGDLPGLGICLGNWFGFAPG